MKFLALLATLFACWAAPAFAIGVPVQLGSASTAANQATLVISTTSDCPAGGFVGVVGLISSATRFVTGVVDTGTGGSDSYTVKPSGSGVAGNSMGTNIAGSVLAHDLPAPATATGSITTTVVTFTTNPGTLTVGQAITGAGVTAATQITGGISQWNGTNASATVNNSQSVVSETLTVSSTITITFSLSSTADKLGVALCSSAISSATTDIAGTGNSTGTSTTSPLYPSSSTVTPAQASELVLEVVSYNAATGTVTSAGTDGNGNSYAALQTVQLGDTLWWGYLIINSTTGIKMNPTLSANQNWLANIWSYQGSGGGAVVCRRSLVGVGC